MDTKRWEEYTIEEKKTLLYYWLDEFGRTMPVWQEEVRHQLDQLLEMDTDLVFATAAILFDWDTNSVALCGAIQQGTLAIALNNIIDRRRSYGEYFDRLSENFLISLIGEFNKKYPNYSSATVTDTSFGSL